MCCLTLDGGRNVEKVQRREAAESVCRVCVFNERVRARGGHTPTVGFRTVARIGER